MKRWQRRARLTIALFGVVFGKARAQGLGVQIPPGTLENLRLFQIP